MTATRVALALTCTLATGCAAHVTFEPAPTASAPIEVRRDYLATHTLQKPERGELALRTRLLDDRPTVTRKHGMLANGQPIADVADLAPLVDATSATRAHIDDALAARQTAQWLLLGGAAVGGAGIAASGVLLALSVGLVPGQGEVPTQGPVSPLLIGAGASFAGGALLGGALTAFGVTYVDDEEDASTAAFASFNADLSKRVGIP